MQSFSVKFKSALMATAAGLVVLFVFTAFEIQRLQSDMQAALGPQQFAMVSAIASEFDDRMADVQRLLAETARSCAALAGNDTAVIEAALKAQTGLRVMFDDVVLLSADGHVRVDLPARGRRGMDVHDRDYFINTVKTGKGLISAPYMGRGLKEPSVMVTTPVFDLKGEVVAVLGGVFHPLRTNFLGRLRSAKVGNTGHFSLWTKDRVILIAEDGSRILTPGPLPGRASAFDRGMAGQDGWGEGENSAGVRSLYGYKQLSSVPWVLVAVLPVAEAYAPIAVFRAEAIGAAMLLAVLLASISWFGMHYLLSPISVLRDAIHTIRSDPFSAAQVDLRRSDEIGDLVVDFNAMVRERHQAAIALRSSEARFHTLVDWSPDAFVVHRNLEVVYLNPAAIQLFGAQDADDVVGRTLLELVHPDFHATVLTHWKEPPSSDYPGVAMAHKYLRIDGASIDVETQTLPIVFDGEAASYLSVRDVTQSNRAKEKIHELAFYDQLTGLPNRTLLVDRLNQAKMACARLGTCGALLFVDLDNFKTLNDTLGHASGDELLKQVSRRLLSCVREGDTVGRMGGDEFLLVLSGLRTSPVEAAADAEKVADKILLALREPYVLTQTVHQSAASIGITVFGDDDLSTEDLLKQADLAMYKTKDSGRNAWLFFNPLMESSAKERAILEDDLRRALERDELQLHFQPQVLADGGVSGAEALIRWQHPRRGMIFPGAFIPLAESCGLILPVGLWVLQSACAQLARWSQSSATAHLTIAVNVSAHQLNHPQFVEQVLAALHQSGATPELLKLELTESLLVRNIEETIAKMTELKAMGVSFSLDDFGTGYSSLSYLKRLPLSQLKIDQSFVKDVLTNTNDAVIARTIVDLARNMGLGVIAEGVETYAQRTFLASIGCRAYQGYFFSRPLPIAAFEAYVENFSATAETFVDGR